MFACFSHFRITLRIVADYGVGLSRWCSSLLIFLLRVVFANVKSIPIFLTHEEGSKSVFLLLKFWGREQEQETPGFNGRVREQMEWEGKGGLLKTSFQKTPVNCLWLIFPAFPLGGFLSQRHGFPLKLWDSAPLLGGGVGMSMSAGDSAAGNEVTIKQRKPRCQCPREFWGELPGSWRRDSPVPAPLA